MGMFATSKTIASKPAAAKKAKPQIEMPGMADLAKLDALIKAATAMKATIEADIKAVGFEHFMDMVGGARPSSFEGTDGSATAYDNYGAETKALELRHGLFDGRCQRDHVPNQEAIRHAEGQEGCLRLN
jgi:hypothetical protein